MSLGGCEPRRTVEARERTEKMVGAREQTVRGRGGGERHEVGEIGCRELRREPHERAREGGGPPDMGEEGLGLEGGGGRGERIGRDEGGGSNDGKTSAEYERGLRESGSMREAEVMLVGFRMRNGFRERLVMGLKERASAKRWPASDPVVLPPDSPSLDPASCASYASCPNRPASCCVRCVRRPLPALGSVWTHPTKQPYLLT